MPENLKNVLLFMSSSGYLVPPSKDPSQEKLWVETWKRIDRFLPDLRNDLQLEEPPVPTTATATTTTTEATAPLDNNENDNEGQKEKEKEKEVEKVPADSDDDGGDSAEESSATTTPEE